MQTLATKTKDELIINEIIRSSDGTKKYVWQTHENYLFESVFVNLNNRFMDNVFCISSQIGCPIGCSFCKTSKLGFKRNLTFNEMKCHIEGMIKDNYNTFTKSNNFEMSFTAMGEPLLNYEALVNTLRYLENNFSNKSMHKNIVARVSTVGILSGIYRLLEENFRIPVLLQISLHSVDDNKRQLIIPYNTVSPVGIRKIIEAGKAYSKKTGNETIIKYMLMSGFNDDKKDIEKLASLLDNKHFCIKLSQLNPATNLSLSSPLLEKYKEYQLMLERKGFETQISISKGTDIEAGCGQLLFNKINEK